MSANHHQVIADLGPRLDAWQRNARQVRREARQLREAKLDLPRTEYAAIKEQRQFSIGLYTRHGRQWIARGVGRDWLPVMAGQKSWSER